MRWRLFRPKQVVNEKPQGTFVMDSKWERSEELRPDRLGPGQDDVPDPEPVRDPWRPTRSLGHLPWS